MADRGLLICLPVDVGEAGEPSVDVPCTKCGRLCWRSIGSLQHADLDAICIDCIPADCRPKVRMREVIALADDQGIDPIILAEAFRAQGMLDDG